MKGNSISDELSLDCVHSLKEFNYTAEIFPAVYGKNNILEAWNNLRLYFPLDAKETRKRLGVQGCFLSHYLLWTRVYETNKPLLILEHDAICLRKIPKNLYQNTDYDVLNLDAHSRLNKNYELHVLNDYGSNISRHGISHISINQITTHYSHIPGAHAYIIKPSGAKKVIDFTNTHGVFPADIALNNICLTLYKTNTSYFRINKKYWLPEKKKSKNSFTRSKS